MDNISFSKDEQETTVSYYRQDKIIEVYSSDMTVITKLKKITKDDNIEVLSRNELGNITSAKFKIDKRQLLFRNIPKSCKIEAYTIDLRP